jgi:carbonic anhydrase
MSCKNGSPINIVNFESLKGKKSIQCNPLLCNFYYNFSNCSCLITNKGNYLDINCCRSSNSLSYNGNDLTIQEVRLYMKSVNKYNDIRYDGELMIFCVGGSKLPSLILCIPIKKDRSWNTPSTKWFSKFSKHIPNDGEKYNVNVSNYTLNSVIPQCGFIEYTGALNIPPCNPKGKVLFFNPDFAIKIKNKDYDDIKANINRSLESTHTKINNNSDNVLWNAKGTSGGPGKAVKNKRDEYILDCTQTTDQNGNPLSKGNRSSFPIPKSGPNSKQWIWIMGVGGAVAVLLLIRYVIIPGGQKAYDAWKGYKKAKKAKKEAKTTGATTGGSKYKSRRRH